MIEPRFDMNLRTERPELSVARWQWLLQPVARMLLRRRLRDQYDRRAKDAALLLRSALKCENRAELEQLLGRPRYAMQGTHYGTADTPDDELVQPDLVEVYERNGCMIEIWFKDGAMMTMHGLAMPTSWQFVAGALDPKLA